MNRRDVLKAFAGLASCPTCARTLFAAEAHWSYEGSTGPDNWGAIAAANRMCSIGSQQSPIDIAEPIDAREPPLTIAWPKGPDTIVNNGHTIQLNFIVGNILSYGGRNYGLVQFHFHHRSETAILGKHSPLEAHLVHKDADGNLAVVAVLLNEGTANAAVATTWANISPEKEKAVTLDNVQVDAAQLLPANRRYYTFPGSLTTPPCTENVAWYVMVNPITVSREQIEKFAKLYPNDERPVQPLNRRVVLESK